MKDKYKTLIIIGIITILLIILIILLLESNNKCINLNEEYEINENDTCPDGYGYMMLLSLFGPNTYKCHPVKDQIYTCNEGTFIVSVY